MNNEKKNINSTDNKSAGTDNMDEQYFYDYDKELFYRITTEQGKEIRFFGFNFEKDIMSQLEFVQKQKINAISIVRATESDTNNILNIFKNKKIKLYELSLYNLTLNNIDFLLDFITLENLKIVVETKKRFDFNKLTNLKKLELYAGKYFKTEDINQKVVSLYLHKVNFNFFHKVDALNNIETLSIAQSALPEMKGVENLTKLKSLSLSYCPKLEHIKSMNECNYLKYFTIRNCKNITDWNTISLISSLESLVVENCGTLPDIEFLDSTNIQELRLINTEIANGKMKWLLNKNFKYLNFPVYKHYDIQASDLWKYQEDKGLR
jgi:hypothetical protein